MARRPFPAFGQHRPVMARMRTSLPPQSRRPTWTPDAAADVCAHEGCGVAFGLFCRRHHCRWCGGLFCASHSSARVPIAYLGYTDAVRVCDQHVEAARDSSHSTYDMQFPPENPLYESFEVMQRMEMMAEHRHHHHRYHDDQMQDEQDAVYRDSIEVGSGGDRKRHRRKTSRSTSRHGHSASRSGSASSTRHHKHHQVPVGRNQSADSGRGPSRSRSRSGGKKHSSRPGGRDAQHAGTSRVSYARPRVAQMARAGVEPPPVLA